MSARLSIAETFARHRASGLPAFIPYLTAGDPTLDATEELALALQRAGAGLIELGIPFSDPLADGPVNQRAAQRALAGGTTLAGVLERVARLRARGLAVPVVLFTYYNPLFAMGLSHFARSARDVGADAVLCVDLPPEEATEYREELGKTGLSTIFLAAPTTRPERLPTIDEASTGFMYYVSRTGVTGAQGALPAGLESELRAVRARVKNPLVVGFGIREAAQAAAVGRLSDGVVVGSAIVELVERALAEGRGPARAIAEAENFARGIVSALKELGNGVPAKGGD